MENATSQIEILADYITSNIPTEPSQSQGAGDTAVRLLKQYREDIERLTAENKRLQDELYSAQQYISQIDPNSALLG